MKKSKPTAFVVVALAAIIIVGCKVNVKKENKSDNQQVDIKSPIGGIHVSQQADVADTGLKPYPGARLREKDDDGSDKSANVNISGFGYGIKVIALEYQSDDSPEKIISFYRDQLKKYGNVLECHSAGHFNVDMKMGSHGSKDGSNELSCQGDHGSNVELKVGKKDDQHIVSVEKEGKGSNFSLVYVRTHGKDAEI